MTYSYQRLDYWSPTLGCEVSRISMVDKNGDEYFVTLPPHRSESDSIVAHRLREAHRRIRGAPPEEGVGAFYSDASHLSGSVNMRMKWN